MPHRQAMTTFRHGDEARGVEEAPD